MQRAAVFLLAVLLSCPAWAQGYPEKPVRMVVPFPAGGPLDLVARIFSPKLAERFGQQFLVENRPGAAGNIGMELAAAAAPDGYTILWVIDAVLTVNPILYRNLRDPMERLQPVIQLCDSASALAVPSSLGVRTSSEFVALSKTRDLSYGSAGPGSPGHRAMEYYKLVTGARLMHVPYKGNAPAVQSLVAGETQAFITPIAGVLAHIRAGRLRALVVTGAKRSPLLPEVPTMVELGYPKFKLAAWYAVLVPLKTPQAIVARLEEAMAAIMQMPDVRERLAASGIDPVWDSAAALVEHVREDRALWAEVIQKSGMKVD